MVNQYLLGTLEYFVVSTNFLGGFDSQPVRHSLGHMGGHALGIWGAAVAYPVASKCLDCEGLVCVA